MFHKEGQPGQIVRNAIRRAASKKMWRSRKRMAEARDAVTRLDHPAVADPVPSSSLGEAA